VRPGFCGRKCRSNRSAAWHASPSPKETGFERGRRRCRGPDAGNVAPVNTTNSQHSEYSYLGVIWPYTGGWSDGFGRPASGEAAPSDETIFLSQ
jgi:hypothetical protein